MLQEIWNPSQNLLEILGGSQIIRKRTDNYGGTLISWDEELMETSGQSAEINQDSVITKMTLASNRIIWIGSTYIPKNSKKNLLEMFANIKQHVPESEWNRILLAGDWNINIDDPNHKNSQTLKTIEKQMGLNIYSPGHTRTGNTLDFIVAGDEIKIVDINKFRTIESDHCLLITEIEIPKPLTSSNTKIPDKKAANNITISSLREANNSKDFFSKIKRQMMKRKNNIMKETKKPKRNTDLIEKILQIQNEDEDLQQIVQDYWSHKIDENEQFRYSKEPQEIKEAFRFLKATRKYHEYDKRDESIVNKILMDDGTIEHKKEEIDKILIGVLKKAQLKENQPQYNQPIPFPKMQNLSFEESEQIIKNLLSGKAIAFDGISDCLFHKDNIKKTAKVFQDLWTSNPEDKFKNNKHFCTRIIPLNKVHPQIPTKEKFRPISICSPTVKLREGLLLEKLRNYMKE